MNLKRKSQKFEKKERSQPINLKLQEANESPALFKPLN